MSTYKLKRKLEDGTLEDVILQGVGGGGGGDIIDLPDQYVRIWGLDTGIYRLTYEGDKYLYYNGTTSTATVDIKTDKPIIYVNSIIFNNKEMRTWISITAHQSTSVRIASGYTSNSSGTVSYFNPSSTVSTGSIVNNLNYSTSDQRYVLSAYQGYVLDQRLQAVEQSGAGGPRKISSDTTSININSSTVGAYFNVFGEITDANELTIGGNSISLDSGYTYYVSVEGMLKNRSYASSTPTNYWKVMVTIKQDGASPAYSNYTIQSTSGFNIADTGQNAGGTCRYSGILSE